MRQIFRKIYHVLGLEESIFLKYPHYPKQSTDLMQIPIKISMTNSYVTSKDPEVPKQSRGKITKLQLSPSQTSDYTKKLQ